MFAHQIEGVLQSGEHAKTEQIKLDQPHPSAVIFVPLHNGAVLHAGVLDRHHFTHRPVGEHHASRVNSEVPGKLHYFQGEFDNGGGNLVFVAGEQGTVALDLLRPNILLTRAVTERFGHIAHRKFGAITDDVGYLRGVVPAVFCVDVLDDLFAPGRIKIDVDVGFFVAHAGEKTLEGEFVEDGVDGGYSEQVTDGAVGGRTATLTEDAAPASKIDDVVHDQKVAGKVFGFDHLEFAFDAGPILWRELYSAARGALPDQLAEPTHGGVAGWNLLLGQPGFRFAQFKADLVCDRDGASNRPRIPPESSFHLPPASQVR